MPTRITHFLHDSLVAPAVPPVLGTAFATADVHAHDLQTGMAPLIREKRTFSGLVEGIHLRLTNLAGGPTKVSIRLCADAAGDFALVPDTEAVLAVGVTTANSACAAFKVDLPLFQILGPAGNGTLYLFAKLDAGTADFAQSCVTWME